MKRKFIGFGAILVVCLIAFLWATKPSVKPEEGKTSSKPGDPLTVPLLLHMIEAESLRIGEGADVDLSIQQSGNEVVVRISPRLVAKLGEGGLEALGLLEMEENMGWNRYLDFLQDLHDKIAVDHSHSAEAHGGVENEGSDTGHLEHE